MSTRVIQLALSISNAYLLIGRHPVLVDAGAPGDEERLLRALRAHDVAPEDLALIVLTHGHTDHTGSVNAVAAGGAPVAIGVGDVGLLEAGANGVLPATGPAGIVLRPLIKRMTFAGASAQVRVSEPLRLEPYGIAGVMTPVGGTRLARARCCWRTAPRSSATWSAAGSSTARRGPAVRCGTTSPRTCRRSAAHWRRSWQRKPLGCSPVTADR